MNDSSTSLYCIDVPNVFFFQIIDHTIFHITHVTPVGFLLYLCACLGEHLYIGL